MEFGSAGGLERSVPNLDGLEKKQACWEQEMFQVRKKESAILNRFTFSFSYPSPFCFKIEMLPQKNEDLAHSA